MSGNTSAVQFDAKKIDAIFAELDQCSLPGAAVGIAIGGRPVYRKGFGRANMELPVVLSPSIRMRIGSTTKHFTALAYMLLCEDGRAGLDDPIGKYLPELHPVTHNVTLRQLMGNIGGLRDVIDFGWQFGGRGQPVSSADLLSLYREIDDVNAAPGTCWIYNNGGWLMLTVAIERIIGQSLEEVLYERIFEPVGMYDTMLRRWDTDFVPNSATLHMTTPAGGYDRSYLGMELTGEAGVVSTVDDMLRWLAHMDAPMVGNAATWKVMKAPQSLANGTSTGYGLGLVTDRYRGVEILYHNGGVMGGSSQMFKVPAAGLDVAIMINRQDVPAAVLANRILDACVPGMDSVGKTFIGPFAVGTFRSTRTGRVIQLFTKDGQQIVSIDGFDLPFVREEDGVLRPVSRFGILKQAVALVGDPEQPASIRFSDFGNVDELIAVKRTEKTSVDMIEAIYRSAAVGTEATICATGEVARLTLASRFGTEEFTLECLAEGIWRARPENWWPPGGILLFDDDGRSRAFRFFSARTRALPFQRVV